MIRALLREVSDTYADALSQTPPDPPIDLARARAQHAAYRETLAALGAEVVTLASDARFPDCCFVEDTAVMLDGVALLTRPGAPSRRGEVEAVAAALQHWVELETLDSPGILDGGDCLQLGRTLYVGRSARTDEAGIAGLRAAASRHGLSVVGVPLPAGVLHLKSVCSGLPDGRLLLAHGTLPPDAFAGVTVVPVPHGEAYAANTLCIGETVLVSAGFPAARQAVVDAGFAVRPLGTTEFQKADGALTCLSILV
jgi:dimethylargininase